MSAPPQNAESISNLINGELAPRLFVAADARIDPVMPFAQMGLTSADAVALVASLNQKLGLEVAPMALFDHPNVDTLSRYLLDCLSRVPAVAPAPVPGRLLVPRVEAKAHVGVEVVGMGLRLPGASDPEGFFALLASGKSPVQPVPSSRLPHAQKVYYAALVEEVGAFEAELFGIPAHEAERMDPQQRLFLESAFSALEDAGLRLEDIRGKKVGVFVGVSATDYSLLRQRSATPTSIFDSTGNAHSIVANRLSYLCDLRGPSLAVDTACSSSLVALHLASASLRNQECDLAIVGGVNVCLAPELFEAFDQAGMLSPDGRCKTFSEGANGYVRGEGAGAVILQRTSDGLSPSPAYAFFEGSAVNQDGRTNGLTAPSGRAQQAVIREALEAAGGDAQDIAFVEAHGTGTSLGDPIEYHSLLETLGAGRDASNPLKVGSVKTLVGHLEAAAGIAGFIKVCLMLHKRTWLGNQNFSRLNPHIRDPRSALQVQVGNEVWAHDALLRAGVSSFGFGGTNAHAILRATGKRRNASVSVLPGEKADSLLLLSAPSPAALQALAQRWAEVTQTDSENQVRAKTESALGSRSELPYRKSVVWDRTTPPGRFAQQLEALAASNEPLTATSSKAWKIIFLMTGQGAQYAGMGQALYRRFGVFRDSLNQALDQLSAELQENLSEVYFGLGKGEDSRVHQTLYAQPCLFAFEHALVQLLASLGLTPHAFIGHSLGELVAISAAGALSFQDAAQMVCARAAEMEKAPPGRMLAVYASLSQVAFVFERFPQVSLAAENGAKAVVLSGSERDVSAADQALKAAGLKTKVLKTQRAFHSSMMKESAQRLEQRLQSIRFQTPTTPIISTVTGALWGPAEMTASFWAEHLVKPTRFRSAVEKAQTMGTPLFLEIGPHPTLVTLLKGEVTGTCVHFAQRPDPSSGASSTVTFLEGLGRLFELGVPWDKKALEPRDSLRHPQLRPPATPLKGRHFWFPSQTSASPSVVPVAPMVPPPAASNIAAQIKQLFSEAVGVPVEELDLGKSLIEYGADSLVLLTCLEKLRDKWGVEIGVAAIMSDLSTLEALIAYVEKHVPPAPSVVAPVPAWAASENALQAETVQEVIHRQLALMENQLRLLQGVKASETRPLPPMNQVKSQQDTASGAGVLGNFKARAVLTEDPLKDEKLQAYQQQLIQAYVRRTQKSKEQAQRYRKPLADNRVSAGFKPRLKELTYPLIAKSAQGARFTDVDDHSYLDLTMGFGVNLYGHSPAFLESPVREQWQRGMAIGPQSDLAGQVAELFCDITGQERVAFVNSGTEAVMTALRLARAATRRRKVVIFEGSYHGHFDGILARRTMGGQTVPVAPGVPEGLTEDLVVLDYGSEEALHYVEANADALAAVLIEPVQSRFPHIQPRAFVQKLRELTERKGCALIFDEVITGLRVGPKGAQGFYGVQADIAAYGKILGGGFPIGAVAGAARYLDFIDGGDWQFGDDSYPRSEMTFFAGTFSKHPLAMAASHAVLKRIKASGEAEMAELNTRTQALAQTLNAFFASRKAPVEVVHFGSLFRFKFTGNLDWLFLQLNLRGIYVWEGRNMFLSTAHTDEDLTFFIKTVQDLTDELIAVGYLAGELVEGTAPVSEAPSPFAPREYPVHPAQLRFQQVREKGEAGRWASKIGVRLALEGPLDTACFARAADKIFARHEILSAKLDLTRGCNVVGARPLPKLQSVDPAELPRDTDAGPWLTREIESDAVLSLGLARTGPQRHELLLVADHIFLDGLSLAFLTDELAKEYTASLEGKTAKLFKVYPLENFFSQQQSERQLEKKLKAQQFWKQQEETLKRLPVFNKRPLETLKGGRVVLEMNAAQFKQLKMRTFKTSCSSLTFIALGTQAALQKVLQRSIQSFAMPVAGHISISEAMALNCVELLTVPLPPPSEATEEGTLQRLKLLKETVALNLKAVEYGTHEIVRDVGHAPFDVVINFEPISDLPKMKDLTLTLGSFPQRASEFPLMIHALKVEDRLRLEMDYQEGFVQDEALAKELLAQVISETLALA